MICPEWQVNFRGRICSSILGTLCCGTVLQVLRKVTPGSPCLGGPNCFKRRAASGGSIFFPLPLFLPPFKVPSLLFSLSPFFFLSFAPSLLLSLSPSYLFCLSFLAWQGLAEFPRLASNLGSSCPTFLSSWVAGKCHHTWQDSALSLHDCQVAYLLLNLFFSLEYYLINCSVYLQWS